MLFEVTFEEWYVEMKGGVAVIVPLAIGVASLQDAIMVTIYGLLRSLGGDMK